MLCRPSVSLLVTWCTPVVLGALGLTGCASTERLPQPAAPSVAKGVDPGESARKVGEVEAATIRALASVDPRLAARARVSPSEEELSKAAVTALAQGDEGVAVIAGATDLFSFEVRARKLAEVNALLSLGLRASEPSQAGALAESAPREAGAPQPRLEWELLGRLVAEEGARLEEERNLPRAASELVRAVVSMWAPLASLEQVKERDKWLGRRLDDIVRSFDRGGKPRAVEVAELEDALDPLERLADPAGFPLVQASLARLRIVIGGWRGPKDTGDWASLREAIRIHFGVAVTPDALKARLTSLEASMREEAKAELLRLPPDEGVSVRARAQSLLLAGATCGSTAGSTLRGLGPPPERAPICAALRTLAHPASDIEAKAALVALSDEVTLALWACEIAGDGRDLYQAASAHPLLSGIPPELEAPLMRRVGARPVLALGVALMADVVSSKGPEARASRAAEWLAFGDAPIDIVARELHLEVPAAWK